MKDIKLHERKRYGIVYEPTSLLCSSMRFYTPEEAKEHNLDQIEQNRSKMRASYIALTGDESIEGFENRLSEHVSEFIYPEVTIEMELDLYKSRFPGAIISISVGDNGEPKVENVEMTPQKNPIEQCIEIFDRMMQDGSATFDVRKAEFVEKGFVYGSSDNSDEKMVWVFDKANFSPLDIAEYIREHVEYLFPVKEDSPEDAMVGTWFYEDRVFVEISMISPDKTIAIMNGLATGQKAIYDLEAKEEIQIGISEDE